MKFLIIQTAFIGDVILATPLIERLSASYPTAQIDFLLRNGNESLLENHPKLNEVIIWNKKENKLANLFKTINRVRETKYDHIINVHRFASSGLITFLSGAKNKIGFDKNPFSFCYSLKVKHEIGNGKHEAERNLELVNSLAPGVFTKPKLYPSSSDIKAVDQFKIQPYVCIAPTSVWFTKQFPKEKWIELIKLVRTPLIYLLGAPADNEICEWIKQNSNNKGITNLSGKLSFLESAALMKEAEMNYVNDSAPLHIASAMNAPITAVFCSTIPAFGFGPLSDRSKIIETTEPISCRPCGLHGFKACPQGHFKCALTIDLKNIIN
ncbi:MAG: glycosyltransferase family 9 protein [Bacteroidetes bacterium]|nr:glycosyltransferase family 9 protein [Bacteroidota bacterium]